MVYSVNRINYLDTMATKKKNTANQKKVFPKTSTTSVTSAQTSPPVGKPNPKLPSKPINYRWFALAGILALLIVAYLMRSNFYVAKVNGQYISRSSYIKAMESQGGQQILDNLITEKLILQQAEQEGVFIPAATIETEISNIQDNLTAQGQDLETALLAQGMTQADLEYQINLQKLVETMSQQGSSVTQEDIDQFIEENDLQPESYDSQEEMESVARDQLMQQRSQTAVQTWLADLRAQADIVYW